MANREKSDPAQHETFPGPGPSKNPQHAGGMPPVEQMVDAAIDRLAREYAARGHDLTPALGKAPKSSGAAPAPADSKLLTDGSASSGKRSGKLRWKGLDVSDEFRQYAERVARGEDLPPYEGKILAEPDPAFPWEPAARRSASRRARTLHGVLWAGAIVVGGLAFWMISVQVGARSAQHADALAADNAEQAILSSRAFPSAADSAEATAQPVSGSAQAEETAAGLGASAPPVDSKAGGSLADNDAELANAGEPTAKVEVPPAAPAVAGGTLPVAVPPRAVMRDAPFAPPVAAPPVMTTSAAASAPGANGQGATAVAPRPSNPAGAGAAEQPGAASPISVPANDASRGNSATPAGTVAAAKPARKEPAPAPSGMGSLLVETPSF